MRADRGVALILALLVLSFLTVVGGALLTTSTIDIWISDNYRASTQTLYLTEAGIDHARELVRSSTRTPSELLTTAAGADHVLSTSLDLPTLLATDDQPLIPSDPSLRSTGQPLVDTSGQIVGYYYVWLRNDAAEGMASPADSNQVLTLVSFGLNWGTRKAIEVTVRKGKFPDVSTDPRLKTVSGLEGLVTGITRNATDVDTTNRIGDYGGPSVYKVLVVNGNADLGPGTGYGVLLVRGELTIASNFTWNGLILVIGQGVVHRNATGTINGGMFTARTRTPQGTLLGAPENVVY